MKITELSLKLAVGHHPRSVACLSRAILGKLYPKWESDQFVIFVQAVGLLHEIMDERKLTIKDLEMVGASELDEVDHDLWNQIIDCVVLLNSGQRNFSEKYLTEIKNNIPAKIVKLADLKLTECPNANHLWAQKFLLN